SPQCNTICGKHSKTQTHYPKCSNIYHISYKLWSPEGKYQLSRYLEFFDSLAFITDYPCEVSADVRKNPKFKKPVNRDHFMWHDFFGEIEECSGQMRQKVLTEELMELFRHLGFEPANPLIGDLLDPDKKKAEKNRKNFAKLWSPTRQGLKERGWKKITRGTIAELYVSEGESNYLKGLWLDPIWQRGQVRVRLKFHDGLDMENMKIRLESSSRIPLLDAIIQTTAATQENKSKKVIDVNISMNKLFENLEDAESMGHRLADYVLDVIDSVE
ncbi:MAG: hypothetical protein JW724_00185, partial [Candidatus Altiarchaeota archaeon]|nr:hypothetical protein [Candidatus Altiarchaeota archaeon]